jgi:ribosomal protein S24E
MDVLNEKTEKLFERKQVTVSIPVENATPSRQVVQDELGKKFGSKEFIVIKEIRQNFGEKKVQVIARIYNSKDSLDKFEQKHLTSRGLKKEEKKG